MKIRTSLLILFFGLSIHIQGQDPFFSQFFNNNRSYPNPAYTGIDGGISLHTTYRNQWFKIPGIFETKYLTVQAASPCLNSAFGLHILHDEEGEGKLNTLNIGFDYAYILRISSTNNIRFGLGANWFQKWIAWDELVFSDQLHYKDGILDNSVSMANRLYDVRPMSMGFKGGIAHRFDIEKSGKDAQVSYGIGVSNFGNFSFNESPPDGFYLNDPLAIRFSGYAGVVLPFTNYEGLGYVMTLIPQIRYEQQSKIKVTTLGVSGYYNDFGIGIFYQNTYPWGGNKNTDAMIWYFGWTYSGLNKGTDMEFGISYDTNNVPLGLGKSNLGGSTNGVIELSLKFHFFQKTLFCNGRRKKTNWNDCKSLMGNHKYKTRKRHYGNTNKMSRKK